MRIEYPPALPVTAHRAELLAAIADHQVVVVAGETGSGKTTQLPKLCLELGRGADKQIAHTQPRRIAARTVAQRIAAELGVQLGSEVGYSVRFNDRASRATRVRVLTDGLLLAEINSDRLLKRYDTIIIDEAHERSLNIDFLLGVLTGILPRRPDLKLIITSATIDPDRFAAHFGGTPVIEVSGRTYPVETRYRPPGPEDDDPIGDAVAELIAEGPGDILAFLSGEREIRDTAEQLRGRFTTQLDVLPLYARLSSADQQRVFAEHRKRRVVLATNVAETSLTVPGIRYVVDPGTARISRYSARLKVQRLPIEPISQASADQRKGRCGRTSDGICIRLYSEEDFTARPAFTDPEILRTSLAAVILQMAALKLGDVESFGFLEPPDRRQVRDGITLLTELGALDEDQRLTKVGRILARLPVDPRLARMVVEADRLRCADEVIVIAAGLSIQDPRERPAEKQAQADQSHARFADERSDFQALLNLHRYWEGLQKELSGSQLRRRGKAEYLHFLRMREWQELRGQLRRAAREARLDVNEQPAGSAEIHQALLAGLLSHVGLRDTRTRAEYQGARGARFAIFPGSGLSRRRPDWVMVGELMETGRLWGRDVAQIDPRWIEPLAGHLVARTYAEPRWSRRRGSAVATERVTLYGLPVVAGRTVVLGPIEPALSRELFLRHALVEGDWNAPHAFLAENAARVDEVRALEERTRRRDLLATEDARLAFFDQRVPGKVVSARHFERWWRDARRTEPELLTYPPELLLAQSPGDGAAGRPAVWKQGELELPLSYRFDPASQADGVTVHIPLGALGRVRDAGFDWLVPALRPELVTTLLRALPKDLRRPLVPIPDTVGDVVAGLRPRHGALRDAVARELEARRGVAVDPGLWDGLALPPHLRMTFSVHGADDAVLAEGTDLEAISRALRPRVQAELQQAAPALTRHGMRRFDVDAIPREVALPDGLTAFPALVDEGPAGAGIALLGSPAAQAAAMRGGTRRLLRGAAGPLARGLRDDLPLGLQVALSAAPHPDQAALLDDVVDASVDALVQAAGGPAWDAATFAGLRDRVAGELFPTARAALDDVAAVLEAARALTDALARVPDVAAEARSDMAQQLGRLVFPGFVTASGLDRLADIVRFLRAAAHRAGTLPARAGRDAEDMRAIRALEARRAELVAARPPGEPVAADLAALRWALEELRVSLFAQTLGVHGTVSVKRLSAALARR